MWINDKGEGFEIVDVGHGTPAAAAGLRTGDIVTELDGQPVTSIKLYDFRETLGNDAPGTTLRLTFWRKGAVHRVQVTLRDLIQSR